MSAIPQEDWLHLAKRAPINGQNRHRHGKEARPNLVVGNTPDRYWAYCQSCKAGGVVMKTHVLFSTKPPPLSEDLTLPSDIVAAADAEPHVQHAIGTFLATKGMDLKFLPYATSFSESRKRLLVPINGQWMGRDTTGKSLQKWLTYNQQSYVEAKLPHSHNKRAVITEDLFSMLKVSYALGGTFENVGTSVFCSLGTKINAPLFLKLIQEYSEVVSFYDGDTAGWWGCQNNDMRLRALSLSTRATVVTQCAPRGLDPKDMSIPDIRAHVRACFTTKGY